MKKINVSNSIILVSLIYFLSISVKAQQWETYTSDGDTADIVGVVRALLANGSNLYVGGQFVIPGVPGCNNIGLWDGNSWNALDGGDICFDDSAPIGYIIPLIEPELEVTQHGPRTVGLKCLAAVL